MAEWKRPADTYRPWFLLVRDAVFAGTGVSLFVYEAVFRSGMERPTLIVGYFTLMGLPFILRKEESRRNGRQNGATT